MSLSGITVNGPPLLTVRVPGPLPPRHRLITVGAHAATAATTGSPFWTNFAPNAVFGFFDNYLMILAGTWIDKQISKRYPGAKQMSPTKLAIIAAGLGNTLSDVFGVSAAEALMGNVFERAYPGMQPTGAPGRKFLNVNSATWGKIAGIATGCLVGLYGGVNAKWLTAGGFGAFTLYSLGRTQQTTGVDPQPIAQHR